MNTLNPTFEGINFYPLVLTADDSQSGLNSIDFARKSVIVSGVTNDANDFIVLPKLSDVMSGHEITILCKAGANFEMRTPASSNEKINGQDSDGTKVFVQIQK